MDDRAPSPEAVLVKPSQENLGPSEEADAEFAKELAKLMTDMSAESRRVDRKTALALWESTVLPGGLRKKRADDVEDDADGPGPSAPEEQVMNFTLITKKGKQQQVRSTIGPVFLSVSKSPLWQTRQLAVPAESALAIQTRSAQLQDKVEQQQLKRLVLDYEQREEAEELKGR